MENKVKKKTNINLTNALEEVRKNGVQQYFNRQWLRTFQNSNFTNSNFPTIPNKVNKKKTYPDKSYVTTRVTRFI